MLVCEKFTDGIFCPGRVKMLATLKEMIISPLYLAPAPAPR